MIDKLELSQENGIKFTANKSTQANTSNYVENTNNFCLQLKLKK